MAGGRLGDIFGHKNVLIVGMTLFNAATLLCALINDKIGLVVGRALQGTYAFLIIHKRKPTRRQMAREDQNRSVAYSTSSQQVLLPHLQSLPPSHSSLSHSRTLKLVSKPLVLGEQLAQQDSRKLLPCLSDITTVIYIYTYMCVYGLITALVQSLVVSSLRKLAGNG